MNNIKLNKKSKYLLACSYNSDSMCLLDHLLKEGISPIVCFVNYQKGNQEENYRLLKDFCDKRWITLETLDIGSSVSSGIEKKENEDSRIWARNLRYQFFKTIYDKYDASGLFIAHNQDDLIEAYLLKDADAKNQTGYGWNAVSEQYGMIIFRPLLNYTKEDIIEYCNENHVPYAALTPEEEKLILNPIRFEKIAKLSEIDRENLLNEMKGSEADKIEFLEGINNKISTGGELDVREIIALDKDQFAETLNNFISSFEENVKITKTLLNRIREMCLNQTENMSVQLTDTLFLTKEYDVLTIGGNLAKPLYSYSLPKPGKLKNEYFELDFSNGAADRGFRLSDYPLTIRPAVPEDLFNVHGFMTPVRKLYYDWRMPPKKKVIWPVIANKYGEIIYIPRYHRLHRTDHTSKFEINFSEDD